jgi:hypothetical protein
MRRALIVRAASGRIAGGQEASPRQSASRPERSPRTRLRAVGLDFDLSPEQQARLSSSIDRLDLRWDGVWCGGLHV